MDLALVVGVVPLKSGELGYTLNDDLRQELQKHRPGGAARTLD